MREKTQQKNETNTKLTLTPSSAITCKGDICRLFIMFVYYQFYLMFLVASMIRSLMYKKPNY